MTSINSKTKFAAFVPSTGRAVRIKQLMESLIKEKSGEITIDDMKVMVHDSVDVYAFTKINLLQKIFEKHSD